jgi:hypothetical protein
VWDRPVVRLSAPFLRQAFDEPLGPFGFARIGRRQVWMRAADGLDHAVSLEWHHSWKVRWDVVHPAVGEVLHGKRVEPYAVSYSGFITGLASARLGQGVVASFRQEDLSDPDRLARGVARATAQVAEWSDDFRMPDVVIDYLLAKPGQKLRDPRVAVPGNWPLRVFTAAALAAVVGRFDARELAERVVAESAPLRGGVTDERNQRLQALLA